MAFSGLDFYRCPKKPLVKHICIFMDNSGRKLAHIPRPDHVYIWFVKLVILFGTLGPLNSITPLTVLLSTSATLLLRSCDPEIQPTDSKLREHHRS